MRSRHAVGGNIPYHLHPLAGVMKESVAIVLAIATERCGVRLAKLARKAQKGFQSTPVSNPPPPPRAAAAFQSSRWTVFAEQLEDGFEEVLGVRAGGLAIYFVKSPPEELPLRRAQEHGAGGPTDVVQRGDGGNSPGDARVVPRLL